jgi:hypothetical protein
MLKSELMEVVAGYFEKEGWKIEVNIPKIEAVIASGSGEIIIDLFGLVQTIFDAMQGD